MPNKVGRPRSDHLQRFKSAYLKSNNPDGCWVWTLSCVGGYGQFKLDGKMLKAHRYSWTLTHGEIPDGLMVLHKCDNPPCVNPAHLFLGKEVDNAKDMTNKGRQAKGVRIHQHKLTDKQVIGIRKLYATGKYSQEFLGIKYGVYQTTISMIVRGVRWKHLLDNTHLC